MWCPPAAMGITLDHLESKYDGVGGYLRHIAVDDATLSRIREALVE